MPGNYRNQDANYASGKNNDLARTRRMSIKSQNVFIIISYKISKKKIFFKDFCLSRRQIFRFCWTCSFLAVASFWKGQKTSLNPSGWRHPCTIFKSSISYKARRKSSKRDRTHCMCRCTDAKLESWRLLTSWFAHSAFLQLRERQYQIKT